jgi:hypothetical protein
VYSESEEGETSGEQRLSLSSELRPTLIGEDPEGPGSVFDWAELTLDDDNSTSHWKTPQRLPPLSAPQPQPHSHLSSTFE